MLQEIVNKHVDDDCLTDVAETVAYLLTNQTVATHLERYKTAVGLDILFSEFEHCIVSSKKMTIFIFHDNYYKESKIRQLLDVKLISST